MPAKQMSTISRAETDGSHDGTFLWGRRTDALRTRVHVGVCRSLSAGCQTGTETWRLDGGTTERQDRVSTHGYPLSSCSISTQAGSPKRPEGAF